MPVMNGLEATKIIKSVRSDLPIIACTAYAMAGDEERCLAEGCDNYIGKPIFRQALINVLNKYVK